MYRFSSLMRALPVQAPRTLFTRSAPSTSRWLHTTRAARSSGIVQHRDLPQNNQTTPFKWTTESETKIAWWLKKYPSNYAQSAVIPLLYIAQEQEGSDNWLTLNAMRAVGERLDMPEMRVFEVASFYTMFNRTPVGKHHIQLCGTTPCMLNGAEKIKEAIENHLGIKEGETTKDGLFTLQEVECLGACVNAPMIQVNNKEFYEYLTPENMVELLEQWKAGKTPKPWNQNHVKTCEGLIGKTSLLGDEPPAKVPCRDLDALRKQLEEEARAKAAEAPDK
jgi:NADH dehydrogenase (ubiquinone) flavoprotein 2